MLVKCPRLTTVYCLFPRQEKHKLLSASSPSNEPGDGDRGWKKTKKKRERDYLGEGAGERSPQIDAHTVALALKFTLAAHEPPAGHHEHVRQPGGRSHRLLLGSPTWSPRPLVGRLGTWCWHRAVLGPCGWSRAVKPCQHPKKTPLGSWM